MEEEIEFLKFTKNNKEISVDVLKNEIPVVDFLLGIAATVKIIKEENRKK